LINLALCAVLSANPGVLNSKEVQVICENEAALVNTAKESDVPVERLICVAHVESKWDASQIGSSGECGVTQVLPSKKVPCASLKKVPVALSRTASLLGKTNAWYRLARGACGKDTTCTIRHTLMGYNAGTAAAKGAGPKLRRAKNYAAKVMRCEKNMSSPLFHEEVSIDAIRAGDMVQFYSKIGGHRFGVVKKVSKKDVSIMATGRKQPEPVSRGNITKVFRDIFQDKEKI